MPETYLNDIHMFNLAATEWVDLAALVAMDHASEPASTILEVDVPVTIPELQVREDDGTEGGKCAKDQQEVVLDEAQAQVTNDCHTLAE